MKAKEDKADKSGPKRMALTFRITPQFRWLVEQLAAHMTVKTGKRHHIGEAVEIAVLALAKKEGLKIDSGDKPA